MELIPRRKRSRRLWSDEEDRRFRAVYLHESSASLAKRFDRPLCSINGHASKLGLKKTKEYMASPAACRLRRGGNVGAAFRFKKGTIPHNKGLRRPGWFRGRMRETQFKKGARSANWLPVGTIKPNSDGYLRLKVADEPQSIAGVGAKSTNWVFLHKMIWERANGPIQPGHRIWWKDGDHANCSLENLELLRDKEHMARTTVQNLPPEIKEVIVVRSALVRRIHRMEKANGKKQNDGSPQSSLRDDRAVV